MSNEFISTISIPRDIKEKIIINIVRKNIDIIKKFMWEIWFTHKNKLNLNLKSFKNDEYKKYK